MNLQALKEQVTHGTKEFPVALYHSQTLIPYQWHNEEEFIYMKSGEADYNINGETIHLKPGDCAFCRGKELHSMLVEEDGQIAFDALLFDKGYFFTEKDICNQFFHKNVVINNYFRQSNAKERKVIARISRICEVMDKKERGYELQVKSLVPLLYLEILQNELYATAVPDVPKAGDKNVILAISHIHANYEKKITVDELAQLTGYSTPYFESFFKEFTGKSPIDYIILYRLKKAEEMLADTGQSVLEISAACGFGNVSYFIRQFKRIYGVTPKKYRITFDNSNNWKLYSC